MVERDLGTEPLMLVWQVWSNEKFHSIEHQVVVNDSKSRVSFPMFLNPDFTADVFPVPELLDENHPPRYTKYNYGYFMRKRTDGNYQQDGKDIQIDDFATNRDWAGVKLHCRQITRPEKFRR